jgi:Cu/Ag efflux pump CusA
MAFESLNSHIDAAQEEAKVYVEKTLAYYKLSGFKVAMKSITLIVKYMLIAVFLLLFVFFVSVSLAFAIGEALGHVYLGFLIVAGFYLLCTIMISFIRTKSIEGPILKKFSEIFFND